MLSVKVIVRKSMYIILQTETDVTPFCVVSELSKQ